TGVATAAAGSKSTPAPQEGQSRTLMVQFSGWRHLTMKEKALAEAREDLKTRLAELAREHQTLDEETKEPEPGNGETKQPAPATAPPSAAAPDHSKVSPEMYSALKHAAEERKHLAELDKRSADFQQLDLVYNEWGTLAKEWEHAYLMRVIEG